MRICTLALLLCALLSGSVLALPTGLAESPGELLTVAVEGLPEATSLVTCELAPGLGDLSLRRDDNRWTGSFALLPGLVNGAAHPRVRCYDARGQELSVEGCTLELAGSTFDNAGLASVLSDPEVRFVFDKEIAADSIWLDTRDGVVRPEVDGQTFVLPFGVAPLAVNAIGARSSEGQTVVIEPDWMQADIATSEEDLELHLP